MTLIALLISCDTAAECPDCEPCEECVYPQPLVDCPEGKSCIVGTTVPDANTSGIEGPASISMAMYLDEACETEPSMELTYDLEQSCFGWVRTVDPLVGVGVQPWEVGRDNSAACMTCFQDDQGVQAMCFREYQFTLTCDQPSPHGDLPDKTTDKVFDTQEGVLDGGGGAYTKLTAVNATCTPLEEGQTFHDACLEHMDDQCDRPKCGDPGLEHCGHVIQWEEKQQPVNQAPE